MTTSQGSIETVSHATTLTATQKSRRHRDGRAWQPSLGGYSQSFRRAKAAKVIFRKEGLRIRFRWPATIILTIGLALATATPGHSDPANGVSPGPYPGITHVLRYYTQLEPDEFFIADHPGVWFLSPTGLNCGIWFYGDFGCAGDIPGAPPGTNHIAWYDKDRVVHHDWIAAVQFPSGQAVRPLPPQRYVTYNGTTCAVTQEDGTYCVRGPFEFLVTPTHTWLNG